MDIEMAKIVSENSLKRDNKILDLVSEVSKLQAAHAHETSEQLRHLYDLLKIQTDLLNGQQDQLDRLAKRINQ